MNPPKIDNNRVVDPARHDDYDAIAGKLNSVGAPILSIMTGGGLFISAIMFRGLDADEAFVTNFTNIVFGFAFLLFAFAVFQSWFGIRFSRQLKALSRPVGVLGDHLTTVEDGVFLDGEPVTAEQLWAAVEK